MAVSLWTCTQHHTWKSTSLLFSPLFLFLVSFSSPSLLFPASLPHLLVSGLHLHPFREAQPHPESHQLLRQLPQRQPHKAETSARHHLEVDPRLHFHSHHGRGGLDGLCRRDPHLAPPRLTVVPAKVTSYAYMCHSVRAYVFTAVLQVTTCFSVKKVVMYSLLRFSRFKSTARTTINTAQHVLETRLGVDALPEGQVEHGNV